MKNKFSALEWNKTLVEKQKKLLFLDNPVIDKLIEWYKKRHKQLTGRISLKDLIWIKN